MKRKYLSKIDRKILRCNPELAPVIIDDYESSWYLFHKDYNVLSISEMKELDFYIQTGIKEEFVMDQIIYENGMSDDHHFMYITT